MDFPLPEELELLTSDLTHLRLDVADAKGRSVPDADLKHVVEYGLQAFGEHDIGAIERQRMVKRFASVCPKAFVFLTIKRPGSSNSVVESYQNVGYTCVLPLNKNGYFAYRRGELSDYHFNERHILSPRYFRPPRYLCLQGFALCTRVNRTSAKSLLEGIAYHVSLHVDGILANGTVLIAEAATRSGLRLLERFAFARIGESTNRVPLFELDCRDYKRMRRRSQETINLLDAMVRQFAAGPNSCERTRRARVEARGGFHSCTKSACFALHVNGEYAVSWRGLPPAHQRDRQTAAQRLHRWRGRRPGLIVARLRYVQRRCFSGLEAVGRAT